MYCFDPKPCVFHSLGGPVPWSWAQLGCPPVLHLPVLLVLNTITLDCPYVLKGSALIILSYGTYYIPLDVVVYLEVDTFQSNKTLYLEC